MSTASVTVFAGVLEHDNYICVYRQYGYLDPISLDINDYSYSVTKGQPFRGIENVSNIGLNGAGCIDIIAGRKRSVNVVDWVKNRMAKNNVKWLPKNMAMTFMQKDQMPNKLNFAVQGNLILTFTNENKKYICPNIILAQGSTLNKVTPFVKTKNNFF